MHLISLVAHICPRRGPQQGSARWGDWADVLERITEALQGKMKGKEER